MLGSMNKSSHTVTGVLGDDNKMNGAIHKKPSRINNKALKTME